MNAFQQITGGTFGSSLNTTIGYDNYGYITSQVTGTIQNYSYNFNPTSGNLNWRQNNKGSNLKEDFTYDNLDRLDNVMMGSTVTLDMAYDGNKGAITTKTDVGTMQYATSGKPYAISTINPATPTTPPNTQTITYTSFDKISTISENNYNAAFTYGIDNQRAKMVVQQGGSHLLTRWYPGATVMKDSVSGTVKTYTYIGGDAYTAPCVAIKQGTSPPKYYYLIRDHLGSITHISDTTNAKLFEYSYDSWGRKRDPATWGNYPTGADTSFTCRGFTGHETLPWFNLINMNGRAYDPLIGQFLSPDNQIQNPSFTQNYNRYSYCLNNPLVYSDPSGDTYLNYMNKNYSSFDYRGGYYSEGQWYQPKLRGGGFAPAANPSYDPSPSFEEHMAAKGYIYEVNEYGIGSWKRKEPEDGRWLYLGEGNPSLYITERIVKDPNPDWEGYVELIIVVFGNQYCDYNFVQTYSYNEGKTKLDHEFAYGGFYNSTMRVIGEKHTYSLPGSETFFQDSPNGTCFNAELTLVGQNANGWQSIQSFTWGYSVSNGVTMPEPLQKTDCTSTDHSAYVEGILHYNNH